MPRLSSMLVAGIALAMIGGIIACSTWPAASDDHGQKTTANQETTTAAEPATTKVLLPPLPPEPCWPGP